VKRYGWKYFYSGREGEGISYFGLIELYACKIFRLIDKLQRFVGFSVIRIKYCGIVVTSAFD